MTKVSEGDITDLLKNENYKQAINQAILNRIGQKVDIANTLLNARNVYPPSSNQAMNVKVFNSLIAEHLEYHRLIMTLKVFEPETNANQKYLTRNELVAYFKNTLNPISYELEQNPKKSVLETILGKQIVDQRKTSFKDASVQCGGFLDNIETVDRKLMAVEMDYLEREKLSQLEKSNQTKSRLEKMRSLMKIEMESELQTRLGIMREREIKDVQVKERERFDKQLLELQRIAENTVRDKLKTLRSKDADIEETAKEKFKQLEGLRTNVERRLLEDMKKMDEDRLNLKQQKSVEYEKFKMLDLKLDKREAEILTKEKEMEVHKKLVEEGLENKRDGVKHMMEARRNLEEKHKEAVEQHMRKSEELEKKVQRLEEEREGLIREVRRREIELEEKSKKIRNQEINIEELQKSVYTYMNLGEKKERTLQLYENRMDRLVQDNIQSKDMISKLREYKPII